MTITKAVLAAMRHVSEDQGKQVYPITFMGYPINDLLDLAERGLAARAHVAPEGWRLVPETPTREMIEAGARASLRRWGVADKALRVDPRDEDSLYRPVADTSPGLDAPVAYRAMIAAAPPPPAASAFPIGTRVIKTRGSSWKGVVVGHYSTSLTPDGVCVESEREPGSVQIYPATALTRVEAADAMITHVNGETR